MNPEIKKAEEYVGKMNIDMSKNNYKYEIIELLNILTVDNYNNIFTKLSNIVYQINNFQNKVNSLQEENNSLRIELSKKDNNILKLIAEKNQLGEEIIELKNLLKQSTYNSKLSNSMMDNMGNDNNKNNNEMQIMFLTQNINQLNSENINLKNQIASLEKEKQDLINNLNSTNINTSNNQNNQNNNQDLQKQIYSLKKEKDELQNKLMLYLNSETNNIN